VVYCVNPVHRLKQTVSAFSSRETEKARRTFTKIATNSFITGAISAAVAFFISSVNVAVCAWYVSCRCARAAGSTCTIEPQSTTVDSPSSHKSQTRAWVSSSKRLSHCLTRKLFRQNRLSTELDLCTRTNQRESWCCQLQFVNYATSWSDGKIQTVLNATQLSVDIYHFHYTDYRSVNVKCNNLIKICSLVSEIWNFKDHPSIYVSSCQYRKALSLCTPTCGVDRLNRAGFKGGQTAQLPRAPTTRGPPQKTGKKLLPKET